MRKSTLSRREMLGHTVHLAVIGSMPILLNACTKPEFSCQDVSGLGEADLELRSALEYRDLSPHGEQKSCSSCAFYKSGQEGRLRTMHPGPRPDSSAGVLQLLGCEGLSL